MELVYHTFGVGETLGLEGKIAVVALPIVVDHKHAGREPVIHDSVGVAKNVCLILVVHQLNPGVILRTCKEECVGQETTCGKIFSLSGQIGRAEIVSGPFASHSFRSDNLAIVNLETKCFVAPHIFSLGGEEERHELVIGILCEEVERRLVLIWLVMSQAYGRTPPFSLGVAEPGKQQKQYSRVVAHNTYCTVMVVKRL